MDVFITITLFTVWGAVAYNMEESLHIKTTFRLPITSIDQAYVFGVSLTHGRNPQKHIWTFVGATDETSRSPTFQVSLYKHKHEPTINNYPSLIGNDYFCWTLCVVMKFSSFSETVFYCVRICKTSTKGIIIILPCCHCVWRNYCMLI